MQQRLDVVELVAVVAGAFHLVLVVTGFEIAVAADTSYAVAASADADAAIAAVDAAIAAPAYAGAGCAFAGDVSETRREADCPVRRGHYLDDRQRLLEACNWHRRWAWTDVRWGLTSVPCGPYRCSETSTCSLNLPYRPYFRVPVYVGNKPHSACRSDCTGETLDKACPVDLLLRLHNGG